MKKIISGRWATQAPAAPVPSFTMTAARNYGKASRLADDAEGNRYLEFWNLVFMQYNTLPSTAYVNPFLSLPLIPAPDLNGSSP